MGGSLALWLSLIAARLAFSVQHSAFSVKKADRHKIATIGFLLYVFSFTLKTNHHNRNDQR